jgi:ribosome-associated translation inhibitor RaiA
MRVQVNTGNHIGADDQLIRRVEAEVDATLGRFGDRITRVEVHLDDVNGPRAVGDDKRCLMEARLAGLQPIAVSHQAPTLDEAVDGAAEKLERSLDRALGRLNDPKGRTSYGGDQTI